MTAWAVVRSAVGAHAGEGGPSVPVENVGIARAGATDADILEALRLAELESWVRSLPDGLETPVGERGTQLSGGERQRIGLARVFLSDAPLVLLDEPTAHLDAVTERAVLDTLHQWGQGRTLLLATHRPLDRSRWPAEIRLDRGSIVQTP
jgi:ABC-type transport system involved in cytochrome bd biosynthesis fused ATPase/permease subunit